MRASYLQATEVGADPHEKVPELSRRARGVPTWAVLRSLGRTGVAALVERLADAARGIADGVAALPGVEVLNDVVFTQVCIALEDDAATEALSERLWDDGDVLAMTSSWHDRAVVRFSVSNWQTDAAQVRRTVDAVARALAGMRAGRADARSEPGVRGIRLNGGMAEALDAFSPATRAWFTESFTEPTSVQREAWQAIARGEHALVVAPDRVGQDLAAFLWAIDRLHASGADAATAARRSSTSRR